jgi:amino acid permease
MLQSSGPAAIVALYVVLGFLSFAVAETFGDVVDLVPSSESVQNTVLRITDNVRISLGFLYW